MCKKTCNASNLFCMICLMVELAAISGEVGAQPIVPYNYGQLQQNPHILSQLYGEQIHPTYNGGGGSQQHPPPFLVQSQQIMQPRYGAPINPIVASRQREAANQQIMFQHQSQRQNPLDYRGGFGGFSPPTFGSSFNSNGLSPIHPSVGNMKSLASVQNSIFGNLNARNDPRPEIPTEIVFGRMGNAQAQEPQAARDLAFGSPLSKGGIAIPDQLLQSVNAIERTSTVQEASAGTAGIDTQLPNFLQGAPTEAIDEYKRIIREPNLKYEDQVKRIEAMVNQKLDPEHQALYKQFMRENDEREERHRDHIHKIVAQMSDKAQEQFAKISAILRSPSTSPDIADRWERVLNIYSRMEPQLRDEFETHFKDFGALQNI